jgi:hypothetical protein
LDWISNILGRKMTIRAGADPVSSNAALAAFIDKFTTKDGQ